MVVIKSSEPYYSKIYGFGEVFEEVSINRALRKITKKYGKPRLCFLAIRCGEKNIRKSEEEAKKYQGHFLEFIPCDNPVWECHFKYGSEPRDLHRPRILLKLSRYAFYILCPIFEFKRDPNLAHSKIGVLDFD